MYSVKAEYLIRDLEVLDSNQAEAEHTKDFKNGT